jgi:hypothetical protein
MAAETLQGARSVECGEHRDHRRTGQADGVGDLTDLTPPDEAG